MFKPNTFIEIGNTGDDNKYPILHNKYGDEFDDRYKVAIPITDYNKITEHFNDIDEKLDELEENLKPSLMEWLYDQREVPLDKLKEEQETMKDKFMESATPQWGLSYRPSNTPHFSMIPPVGDSHRKFFIDQLVGNTDVLSDIFTPKLKLPDTVDINVRVNEPFIHITTWIHTIVSGEHKEQQFTMQRWVGHPPVSYQKPVLTNPWECSSLDEVKEYCDQIIEWKQRELDNEKHWTERNKTMVQVHKEMLIEIEACIENGKLWVREGGNAYYGSGGLKEYAINPWAYWVSPKSNVPDVFKNSLHTPQIYRGM